jgi:hypothetical protein
MILIFKQYHFLNFPTIGLSRIGRRNGEDEHPALPRAVMRDPMQCQRKKKGGEHHQKLNREI